MIHFHLLDSRRNSKTNRMKLAKQQQVVCNLSNKRLPQRTQIQRTQREARGHTVEFVCCLSVLSLTVWKIKKIEGWGL